MKPAPFDYLAADSVHAAVQALAAAGYNLAVTAGGGERLNGGMHAISSKIVEWRRLHFNVP